MREKVKNLIYLDTQRYMSIDNLKAFYWCILIIPVSTVVMGVASIQVSGVSWKTLFPIVSTIVWSFIYWLFVLIIKSNHVKKTFTLRFIVNGVSGLLLSSLLMIFFFSLVFSSDIPFLSVDFIFWVMIFYIIFSLVYIALIILCIQKDFFATIRKKTQTKTFIIISAFFGELIPGAGVSGMYISRMMRSYAEIDVQYTVIVVLSLALIFIPALAHINFVQYYYCKKYNITCDENGNETSPNLEEKAPKTKNKKMYKTHRKSDKKKPLFLKILIAILCVPIAVFLLLLFIGFLLSI